MSVPRKPNRAQQSDDAGGKKSAARGELQDVGTVESLQARKIRGPSERKESHRQEYRTECSAAFMRYIAAGTMTPPENMRIEVKALEVPMLEHSHALRRSGS